MYLALRGGPRRFTRAFPDPVLLGNIVGRSLRFRVRGRYPLRRAFPERFHYPVTLYFLEVLPSLLTRPTTPSQHRRQAVPLRRFRLFPFRSPLLRESLLLSFPRGTEMFQFPRCPPLPYVFRQQWLGMTPAGFPHSDIRGSKLGRQLPAAFRSHPRPSSASGAKASTVGSS